MAEGPRRPDIFSGKPKNSSLVHSLQSLEQSSTDSTTLNALAGQAIAELDDALDDVEDLNFSNSPIEESELKSAESVRKSDKRRVSFSGDSQKKRKVSVRNSGEATQDSAKEDFDNPFVRSSEYLEKRQSAITNPVYTEEYEEYVPLKRINKSRSVGENPVYPNKELVRSNKDKSDKKKRRSGVSSHLNTFNEKYIAEAKEPKQQHVFNKEKGNRP